MKVRLREVSMRCRRFFTRRHRKGVHNLNGRVAVVTGAANGIGRAVASGLWSRGCHLALVDRDPNALALVQSELRETGQDRTVTAHLADVGDRAQMSAVAADVAEAHGPVHLLVNSAGVAHEAAFPQTSLDEWERILGSNLWGVIHACHFFMPLLAKADRAHIVNLSSLLGLVGMPGQTSYCTTKYAVRGFSESLAEELRTTSIGLTVVYPGAVATNIMRRAHGDDIELLERISRWYDQNAMLPERVAERIIRAVERGKPRLLIGAEVVLGDYLRRLMPETGNRLMVDTAIRALGVGDMRAKRIAQWKETMVDAAPTLTDAEGVHDRP
jgi:short-subunit dehydrogenase